MPIRGIVMHRLNGLIKVGQEIGSGFPHKEIRADLFSVLLLRNFLSFRRGTRRTVFAEGNAKLRATNAAPSIYLLRKAKRYATAVTYLSAFLPV